jgi:hypothetical protein
MLNDHGGLQGSIGMSHCSETNKCSLSEMRPKWLWPRLKKI